MATAHPFGGTALAVEDCARVVCVLFGLYVGVGLIRALASNTRRTALPTVFGLMALVVLCYSAVFTEVGKLGRPIFEGGFWWRLPVNFVGLLFAAVYVHRVERVASRHREIGL